MKPMKVARRVFLGLMLAASSALGLDFGVRQATNEKIPVPQNHIDDARSVFGNTIDYSKVRVSFGKVSCLQSSTTITTIGNTIYCPDSMERPLDYMMIHEMTHIWQQQNNIKGTGAGGVIKLWMKHKSYEDAYAYTADSTKALTDYNLEQQGEIISDYYHLREELKADSCMGTPDKFFALRAIIKKSIPLPDDGITPRSGTKRGERLGNTLRTLAGAHLKKAGLKP